jgi:hypothetical protein
MHGHALELELNHCECILFVGDLAIGLVGLQEDTRGDRVGQ